MTLRQIGINLFQFQVTYVILSGTLTRAGSVESKNLCLCLLLYLRLQGETPRLRKTSSDYVNGVTYKVVSISC